MKHIRGRRISGSIIMATILALGALTLWFAGAFLAAAVVDQYTKEWLNEAIEIRDDGEVIVRQMSRSESALIMMYRSADGRPMNKPAGGEFISGVSLQAADARNYRRLLPWSEKIACFGDTEGPANFWYLIRGGQHVGHAFFMGYNVRSNQFVGYLGLRGFSSQLPAETDQFAVINQAVGLPFAGAFSFGQENHPVWHGWWIAYVISGKQLFKVNFTQRTVEHIPLPDDVLSIDTGWEPIKPEAGPDAKAIRANKRQSVGVGL